MTSSRARPGRRTNHGHDRQLVFLREVEVAFVVRRNGHHGARAVLAQHEVGDPDRHRLAGERIDREAAGEEAFLGTSPVNRPARSWPRKRCAFARNAASSSDSFANVVTSACSGASITNVAP